MNICSLICSFLVRCTIFGQHVSQVLDQLKWGPICNNDIRMAPAHPLALTPACLCTSPVEQAKQAAARTKDPIPHPNIAIFSRNRENYKKSCDQIKSGRKPWKEQIWHDLETFSESKSCPAARQEWGNLRRRSASSGPLWSVTRLRVKFSQNLREYFGYFKEF